MLQVCIVLLSLVASGLAGNSDLASGNDIGSNNGYGYGYSGSYSGTGNPPENFNFPHFDFNNLFSNFQRFQQDLQRNILAQAEATQNFAKAGSPTGSAGSFQEGYGGGYSGGQSFGGSFSGGYPGGAGFQFIPGVGANFGSGADGASAFGSIGPDGIQQKASIFPENPNIPNVNVRFGADGNPNGFKSVFTSSSSMTTNVDGKPKTVKQASTTVNDNGKITTYTAKYP
ncbi:unnamed protein product [Psylliodes chrysocephalus]|uniref:Uncharacterized protein n=1 Tax=Psylliodes chrysocephalus TaxID=3402493 RepID=A0A9P0GA62_9CUCU|nr:unnamed protein product [Psylliodes chrysocephala]